MCVSIVTISVVMEKYDQLTLPVLKKELVKRGARRGGRKRT